MLFCEVGSVGGQYLVDVIDNGSEIHFKGDFAGLFKPGLQTFFDALELCRTSDYGFAINLGAGFLVNIRAETDGCQLFTGEGYFRNHEIPPERNISHPDGITASDSSGLRSEIRQFFLRTWYDRPLR